VGSIRTMNTKTLEEKIESLGFKEIVRTTNTPKKFEKAITTYRFQDIGTRNLLVLRVFNENNQPNHFKIIYGFISVNPPWYERCIEKPWSSDISLIEDIRSLMYNLFLREVKLGRAETPGMVSPTILENIDWWSTRYGVS
jgi:hypothetical protein